MAAAQTTTNQVVLLWQADDCVCFPFGFRGRVPSVLRLLLGAWRAVAALATAVVIVAIHLAAALEDALGCAASYHRVAC